MTTEGQLTRAPATVADVPRGRSPVSTFSDEVRALLSELEFPGAGMAELWGRILPNAEASKLTRAARALGAERAGHQVFVFPGEVDACAVVERAITTGDTQAADLSRFDASEDLARLLVSAASVAPGMRVLEPSAGLGRVVLALQDAGAKVVAAESDVVRREHLLARVLKSRDRLAAARDFLGGGHAIGDVGIDRVAMMPPFCRSGAGDYLDHLQFAHALLRPGGVLAAALPATLLFRQDGRHRSVLAWCLERGTVKRHRDAVTIDCKGGLDVAARSLDVAIVRLEKPGTRVAARPASAPAAQASLGVPPHRPTCGSKPCSACPFRRRADAGWLGENTPEALIGEILSERPLPCHPTIDYGDPDWLGRWNRRETGSICAGSLIMSANMGKLPRDRTFPRLPSDPRAVFASPDEFITHHRSSPVRSWEMTTSPVGEDPAAPAETRPAETKKLAKPRRKRAQGTARKAKAR